MPKFTVNAFLTLDGVMQAPGGPDEDREGDFLHGGWQGPFPDPVMGRLVTEGLTDADGFRLGELRTLRAQPGHTVQTWGSTELLQVLLENDLIDEYRLFIFPVMLGSGKRLLGSGTIPMAFKTMESVTSDKGATYLRLVRSAKPEYGQIER